MKTFKQIRTEGWFKKKEKEDPDYEELKKLGAKAAGRGGWSKKEQDRYNDLWMKMHKKGQTPTMSPPSVYGDDSWGTKTKKLHKKLGLKKKDHDGVIEKRDYKAEYKKFQSSPERIKYRAELVKYNREKGTYGNGDKKDASHKGGKIVGFEDQSKNRGRAEASRLKKTK